MIDSNYVIQLQNKSINPISSYIEIETNILIFVQRSEQIYSIQHEDNFTRLYNPLVIKNTDSKFHIYTEFNNLLSNPFQFDWIRHYFHVTKNPIFFHPVI